MTSKDIDELKIRLGNIEKQMEKVVTNDLPHLFRIACINRGMLMVIMGLVVALLVLVVELLSK